MLPPRARARVRAPARARAPVPAPALLAALAARMRPASVFFSGWRGRRIALAISTFFLLCGILLIAMDTLSKLKNPDHDYSLELCSVPLVGEGSSSLYRSTFVTVVTAISLNLIGLHIFMFWASNIFLSSKYVINCLSPLVDTLVAYFGLILSLISSTFSQYKANHHLMSIVLFIWAFFLQLFLKPKTNFGILTCVGSASFTILTAVVKCLPDTKSEIGLFVLGFFLYPFLYYLYSRFSFHPTQDDVYITCLIPQLFRRPSINGWIPLSPRNLVLETLPEDLVQNSIQNFPNNFLHLIPLPEKASFQLVPSSSFDNDLRTELLRSRDPKWEFLRTYYRITIPMDSSQLTSNPASFPSPTLPSPSHISSLSRYHSSDSLFPPLSPDEELENPNEDPASLYTQVAAQPLDLEAASPSRLEEGTSTARVGSSRRFPWYGQS